MPTAEHSVTVCATAQRVWAVLLDKAENPGRYIPGCTASNILERDSGSFLCRLVTDRFDIVERVKILHDQQTVRFEVVDHPQYTGTLINRIEPELSSLGWPVVTFSLDWCLRTGVTENLDLSDVVRDALQRTKELAEAPPT